MKPESHPPDLQRIAPVTISQLRQLSGQTETNHEPLEIMFWENFKLTSPIFLLTDYLAWFSNSHKLLILSVALEILQDIKINMSFVSFVLITESICYTNKTFSKIIYVNKFLRCV